MAFCFKNRRPQSMIYTPQIWHPQHFHKGILTPPPPPPPPRLLPLRVMPRLVSFRSLEFKLYRELIAKPFTWEPLTLPGFCSQSTEQSVSNEAFITLGFFLQEGNWLSLVEKTFWTKILYKIKLFFWMVKSGGLKAILTAHQIAWCLALNKTPALC